MLLVAVDALDQLRWRRSIDSTTKLVKVKEFRLKPSMPCGGTVSSPVVIVVVRRRWPPVLFLSFPFWSLYFLHLTIAAFDWVTGDRSSIPDYLTVKRWREREKEKEEEKCRRGNPFHSPVCVCVQYRAGPFLFIHRHLLTDSVPVFLSFCLIKDDGCWNGKLIASRMWKRLGLKVTHSQDSVIHTCETRVMKLQQQQVNEKEGEKNVIERTRDGKWMRTIELWLPYLFTRAPHLCPLSLSLFSFFSVIHARRERATCTNRLHVARRLPGRAPLEKVGAPQQVALHLL